MRALRNEVKTVSPKLLMIPESFYGDIEQQYTVIASHLRLYCTLITVN